MSLSNMVKYITHISLALLVFVSSSGFVFSQHYCMGMLKSTALFGEATQCHQQKTKQCPLHSKTKNNTKGCCDTKTQIIAGIDYDVTVSQAINLLPAAQLTIIDLPLLVTLSSTIDKQPVNYFNFHPPPILQDIPVLLQSFLL